MRSSVGYVYYAIKAADRSKEHEEQNNKQVARE